MSFGRKLVLAMLVALVLLGAISGSAPASRWIAPNGGGRFVTASSFAITFTDEEATFSIVCEIEMLVSLHSVFVKTSGSLIGNVQEVRIRNCRGGTVTFLALSLPMHVTYVSFSGTLPNITSVRMQFNRYGFLVSAFFGLGRCLYGGNFQVTTFGAGARISTLRADERRVLPLVTNLGGFECPSGGVFRGSWSVFPTVELVLV